MDQLIPILGTGDIGAARKFWVGQDVSDADYEAATASADALLVLRALSGKVLGTLPDDADMKRLRDVAMIYELAASGALATVAGNMSDPESAVTDRLALRASAFVAYDLLRAIPNDSEKNARLLDTLNLCALGYLGDRGVDLHTLLRSAPKPAPTDRWDDHLVAILSGSWRHLFTKRTVDDLVSVLNEIAQLRRDQQIREASFLSESVEPRERQYRAMRALALYNWARATELLAGYLRSGSSSIDGADVDTQLDKFFGNARRAASILGDYLLEGLLWSLHAAARRMTELSIWRFERIPSVTNLVRRLARDAQPVFEFLPPQRDALLSAGVLDAAKTAIVIDMPTSSGKTLLAEFRIAQTLTSHSTPQDATTGRAWAAYVVPTRALASQMLRRLRKDFAGQFRIESLSAAVEVDSLEQDLLAESNAFDVLVCTPEKLASLIRQRRLEHRPLVLVVMDEAQTIGDDSRGLNAELLLATLRSETQADFVLIMPYVTNAREVSMWLAREGAGSSISLSAAPWKPNDILIGTFAVQKGTEPRQWSMKFDPVLAPRSLRVNESLLVQQTGSLNQPFSSVRATGYMAATAMAAAFDDPKRGINLIMCGTIGSTWKAAEELRKATPAIEPSERRDLVRRFVETEISPKFALASLLTAGIGVHHAGLPDEIRSLIELLAEDGLLRALCATSTIAQGINFNVSSVFLSSLTIPDRYTRPMESREFWNLAGRAGRVGQSPVGVIGVFAGENNKEKLENLIRNHSNELSSRLETLVDLLHESDLERSLSVLRFNEDWADFRSYVAHMCAHVDRPSGRDADQLVRSTLGYRKLIASDNEASRRKAETLLLATRQYVDELAKQRGLAAIADGTGFSPDAVSRVTRDLRTYKLRPDDWRSASLFSGGSTSVLPQLIGAMMQVPQIKNALSDLGGRGDAHKRIADIATDWVQGQALETIATKYFAEKERGEIDLTGSISKACRAIFRNLTYAAPWGLSAVMQIPNSGLAFDRLTDAEKHELNLLPAFLYHGVNSESAVAMRINGVPRSIASQLANQFDATGGAKGVSRIGAVRRYLEQLSDDGWDSARPRSARISGSEYRRIWTELSPQ